jgi:hypothetical protein
MNRHLRRLTLSCLDLLVLFSASISFAYGAPAASITTLTLASGGNAVTTVTSGSVVTLTAAVTSNSAKVTVGQVNFCDASVTYCTGIHLLDTAQLTSAGTAVLKLLPPPGSHGYKAVFAGTKTMATSTSATSPLTVTGSGPSATSLSSSGSEGNWSLSAAVTGSGPTPPTGTMSLLNASTNNAVIATETVSGGGGPSLLSTGYFSSFLGYPAQLLGFAVTGDFNGDGYLDVAGTVYNSNTSSSAGLVLLGDGMGHFKAAAGTIPQSYDQPPVAADFNSDGILDLVVSGQILLGNGDGTFRQGQIVGAQTQAGNGIETENVAVGDFNGDGIPDLAFLNASQGLVQVYLGNGDGTFTASPLAPPSAGPNAVAMVAGDFNGDGIADLAVTSAGTTDTVQVFLANGDGSFTATTPIPLIANTQFPTAGLIVASDFNGDGNLDLAVVNGNGSVEILLGDGHGNFPSTSGTGVGGLGATEVYAPIYLACGDFNGDGITDLIINVPIADQTSQGGGTTAIALGNGDGTFSGFGTTSYGPVFAVGDLNGDGITDLVSELGPYISAMLTNVTFSGVSLTPGSGSQQVVASYSGDSNYAASTSPAISLQATQGTPTVTLMAPAASIIDGTPLTATVTGGGLVPTGSVTFYDGSGVLGTVQLSSAGAASVLANAVALGTNSFSASYLGDANYVAAVSPALVETVTAAGTSVPTLTVKPASTTIVAGQTLAVSITVSGAAGGPAPTGWVNLADLGYASVQPLSAGAATYAIPAGSFGIGANTLTATYSGDPVYAAATATVTVTMPPALISIPSPSPISPGGSVSETVTFSQQGNYQGTMNVTCALTSSPMGAQTLPTCELTPDSVSVATNPTGNQGTLVLAVHTTGSSTASLRRTSGGNLWRIGGGGAVLTLMLTCGISSRRRRWISMLALLSVFSVVVATIGCGGGSSTSGSTGSAGTTAGNYVFTVTGTDASNASITATATVTVTVQ